MMGGMRYREKRPGSSGLVPMLAVSVLGFALVTCSDATPSPSDDGGLSDHSGGNASQSGPAGGAVVFPTSCNNIMPGGLNCPSGEDIRICEEYKTNRAGVAQFQEACDGLKGTFSMEPCSTDFRERCEMGYVSVSYYHNCELVPDMRGLIEGSCESEGRLITK